MKKVKKTSSERALSIIKSPIMTEKSTNLNQFNKKVEAIVNFSDVPDKPIRIMQLSLTDTSGDIRNQFDYQEAVVINMLLHLRESNRGYRSSIRVLDSFGHMIFAPFDSDFSESALSNLVPGQYKYQVTIPNKLLKPGLYSTIVIVDKAKGEGKQVDRHDSVLTFEITDTTTKCGTEGHGYNNLAIVAPELKWKLISLDHK